MTNSQIFLFQEKLNYKLANFLAKKAEYLKHRIPTRQTNEIIASTAGFIYSNAIARLINDNQADFIPALEEYVEHNKIECLRFLKCSPYIYVYKKRLPGEIQNAHKLEE